MSVEARQMFQLVLAFSGLFAFGYLYALGGRGGTLNVSKSLRRYVGSAVFVVACLSLAATSGVFSWWMLLSYPCLAGALTMGYGADDVPGKLRRRALYAVGVTAASAPFLLSMGQWETFLFQIVLGVSASVFYGLLNPTSAVAEEGAIGTLLVATWPFAAIR